MRHAGSTSARDFAPGERLRAISPSPFAEIKNQQVYTVEKIEMEDQMGYVRLQGISERYRPYLFIPAATRLRGRPDV